MIDPSNPVVALCAEGMALEGSPPEARRCFEQAWEARRDDLDAAIAAHYLARHQPTVAERLHWNRVAAQHADAVTDGRADALCASLYLNLADALAVAGETTAALHALERAAEGLPALPAGGYRQLIEGGIERLRARLQARSTPGSTP